MALLRPTTLASQSDRRLFVTDAGNARILSIKLGYETSERIPLAEVPDQETQPAP
ncbi:MAG: hypothetical protein L6R28_13190 [Planctomycetes bacterium]|nr:hypothetical protein [Planctomycetota bacterium]